MSVGGGVIGDDGLTFSTSRRRRGMVIARGLVLAEGIGRGVLVWCVFVGVVSVAMGLICCDVVILTVWRERIAVSKPAAQLARGSRGFPRCCSCSG